MRLIILGVGAFFNRLSFGQMYGFHIVILPIVLIALVGMHLLLVRIRGIVHPYAPTVKEEMGENRFGEVGSTK